MLHPLRAGCQPERRPPGPGSRDRPHHAAVDPECRAVGGRSLRRGDVDHHVRHLLDRRAKECLMLDSVNNLPIVSRIVVTALRVSPMSQPDLAGRVAAVRRFNRFYTRKIGVLNDGLLGSGFSLTVTRVLDELAHARSGAPAPETRPDGKKGGN